jgi:predicted enzyme related to lactoylglutathione lyase
MSANRLPLSLLLCFLPMALGCATSHQHAAASHSAAGASIHYLEIVTPAVNNTCTALANSHGITFGQPIAELGNARTAALKGGGRIGVRAPMRDTEAPVVRPYILVRDITSATAAAESAGAQIALPPTPIPGQGTIAIYVLGGIDHGLWQLEATNP